MSFLRKWWRTVNPYYLMAARRGERLLHRARALPVKYLRRNWPKQRVKESDRHKVGVVVVNFNTKDHIARLVYSLYRSVPQDRLARVVVVDNASTDGSKELLVGLRNEGLIDLIANTKQKYHGPGVNQGIKHLCNSTISGDSAQIIDYVWVLDSDTVVSRRDTLDQAVDALQSVHAGLAGEFQFVGLPSLPDGYAHICSLLIDPLLVWQRMIDPMWESGSPAEALQVSCKRRGIPRLDFGFMRDGYVIHLGASTLKVVHEQGARSNRYSKWAEERRPYMGHFHDNPHAPLAYEQFLSEYNEVVPNGSIPELVAACRSIQRTKSKRA